MPFESGRRAGLIALAAFIGATLSVYVVSGLVTSSSVGGWYQTLTRPSFNPPDWVFAPVWSALYLMIAAAGWMAWRRTRNHQRRRVVTAWGLQLALNFLWSVLFFGLHWVGIALIDIVLLWAAILWTIVVFWPVERIAALLLIPYAAWVTFAIALNGAIWGLN